MLHINLVATVNGSHQLHNNKELQINHVRTVAYKIYIITFYNFVDECLPLPAVFYFGYKWMKSLSAITYTDRFFVL